MDPSQDAADSKRNPDEENHRLNMLFCFGVFLNLIAIVSCLECKVNTVSIKSHPLNYFSILQFVGEFVFFQYKLCLLLYYIEF